VKGKPVARIPESLEKALLEVWRQAMVEDAEAIQLEGSRFPVKRTTRHRLRQVDFVFEGREFRGLEQNPDTGSRWARLAREGKKVMQFLSQGKYAAVIVDGKVTAYGQGK
jgi:hypothetical protein